MKNFFAIAILAFISLFSTANASVNRFEQGLIVFDAVPWEIGSKIAAGNIQYLNTTDKSQFVQINVDQGDVNTYVASGKWMSCISVIGAAHDALSKFCVLPPKSELHINLDTHTAYAKGSYQIGI